MGEGVMEGFFIIVALGVAAVLFFTTLSTRNSYRKWEPVMRKRVQDAQDDLHKAYARVEEAEQRLKELVKEN